MTNARHTSSNVLDYAGPLVYFVGDSLPDLEIEIDYDAGGPVVLTTATVNFAVSRLKGMSSVYTASATITDSNHGFCILSWGSFVFNSPGTYIGQGRITYSGRSISTQKFLIEVREGNPGL